MYTIDFLRENSRLPGPRANLELLYQFIEKASWKEIENCLSTEDTVLSNAPSEFVLMCGVAAWIAQTAKSQGTLALDVSKFANHESWRVRESVCIGYQNAKNFLTPNEMLKSLYALKCGSALEKRAYIATLCDPLLLIDYISPAAVITDLLEITLTCFYPSDKLTDDFKVLRKALGYCWSVAICAEETVGKMAFEKLLHYRDNKHILWVVKENLKKNRLEKLDPSWLKSMKEALL